MYKVNLTYRTGKKGKPPKIELELPFIPNFGDRIHHEKLGITCEVVRVIHYFDKNGNYRTDVEAENYNQ